MCVRTRCRRCARSSRWRVRRCPRAPAARSAERSSRRRCSACRSYARNAPRRAARARTCVGGPQWVGGATPSQCVGASGRGRGKGMGLERDGKGNGKGSKRPGERDALMRIGLLVLARSTHMRKRRSSHTVGRAHVRGCRLGEACVGALADALRAVAFLHDEVRMTHVCTLDVSSYVARWMCHRMLHVACATHVVRCVCRARRTLATLHTARCT